MPAGGAGLYLFYTNFFGGEQEFAYFRIRVNGQGICAAFSDITNSATDNGTPSCAAVATLTEGIQGLYSNRMNDFVSDTS